MPPATQARRPQPATPPREPDARPDELAETTAQAILTIGNRIRELRGQRGMTLQALATASGLSPSMLSLIERGRTSPSIGSLVVIARALQVGMSDLLADNVEREDKMIVRSSEAQVVETARHVVRRLLREDLRLGVSIAINEYAPNTGSAERPISHDGYEFGFVLEGVLTVEIDGCKHQLNPGDLISYSSTRKHRLWNHQNRKVRTLWFNLNRS
ncbi:MAG: helix-turn-helix domain-containing protein [Aestuariivirga sp.]|jgi:transcriptional regulator with XRE-family HTH domain|nr:helix-turn-helix domain-containing protein [Aestuariivirga sp.]